MNRTFRAVLYVVLTVASCVFGYLTYTNYTRLMSGVMENAAPSEAPALETSGATLATRGYAGVMIFGALFFVSVLGLGFLLGHDLAHHLGDRVLRGVHNDEGEGMADPDYEAAEQVCSMGITWRPSSYPRLFEEDAGSTRHSDCRDLREDLNNNLAAALSTRFSTKQPGVGAGQPFISAISISNEPVR